MDLISKYCDRGDCPDEDKELEAVSRFMSKSSESFTDWDWDGSELVVFDDDDEVERYSKSDLIEEGVLSKDTCKSCGQEVNSKSNKVEVEDNACKGTYDDMPDKELHYFLMGDDEDFDQSNFDRESSIEQAEDLCNEAEVMGSFDENGDAI